MGIVNYNHESIQHQKSLFLPMFCRLSIKEVAVPIAADDDPSSPRVSCTGQVTGFHRPQTRSRKLHFSTKTLLPNPTTTARRKSGSSSREMCVIRDSRRSVVRTNYDHRGGNRGCVELVMIDISKMDPPLPVVKRVAPPDNSRDQVNIWKRRFDGVKSMQIEPIHLPGKKIQPPTV